MGRGRDSGAPAAKRSGFSEAGFKDSSPEQRILDAYQELSAFSGREWVGMGALRDESGLSRVEFDAAVSRMAIKGTASAIPEENQKTLSEADRRNAVRVGGGDRHLFGVFS